MCTDCFQRWFVLIFIPKIECLLLPLMLKTLPATFLIVFSLIIGRWSDPDPAFYLFADPDPWSQANADPCSVCIVELHGSLMAFRGARNMRMSVGSMNPFQTMGKADFTLIDPR